MADTVLKVLVVEDEPVAATAHATYVDRVDGFECVATAGTSRDALQVLRERDVDVVLLDMNLPDRHGLDVVRAMRAAGHRADVIAVTSARDLEVVRAAVSLGVVQYVLKPFVFATLRDRLTAYRSYRLAVRADSPIATQADVDSLFSGARPTIQERVPKGMTKELLDAVVACLRESPGPLSAGELATSLGVSRVTARRYAEHLVSSGQAGRSSRYSGAGRPEVEYALTSTG